jgi:hypothetical protein
MLRTLALLVALTTLGLALPLQAQWQGEGPVTLFLHYTCRPEKRAAFRAHMQGPGVAQFEKWKKQGVFEDYLILFSAYVNPTWDMLIRLDFDKYVDTEKWKVYANQYHQGPAWDILWVLEYKDTAGLASREVVRQSMRKRYADIPGWRFARETPPGEESRAPEQPTLADPILPR